MATINYDFYCGEDKYSDGAIENYLRYLAENCININSLAPYEKTYPVVYHLSHLRENIINWYPIKADETVLEIGAGCGAITGALCRKAAWVVSVELSKRRAEINYQRHSDVENLTIYVGNQNDIHFDQKFDYVIMNGVFEYAMSFTEGDDPYRTFLEKSRSFLKPNGKLLIAIENRLGLKYFTGAAEDHTGNYFVGLNQYPENNTVRTFSKSEWIRLLDRCGLNCKFYYPYPDYKFPVEIFTDATLDTNGYGKPYYNLENNRFCWLHEQELAKTFIEEGVASSFVNSFFLEISADKDFSNVDYCKISCDRREDRRIYTSVLRDGDHIWIEKQAANPLAQAHIENLYHSSNQKISDEVRNLPGKWNGNSISFEFISGNTLSQKLLSLMEHKRKERIKTEIAEFFDKYFSAFDVQNVALDAAFEEVFGSVVTGKHLPAVCNGNIDLIFDNIYCMNDGYSVIDPEWVFPFAVPMHFIVWRALYDFYDRHPELEEMLPVNEILVHLGVDLADTEVFKQWNIHFCYNWLKVNSLESFMKPAHVTTMDYMVSLLRSKTMLSCSLYYDCGEGYAEGRKLCAEVPLINDCFSVTFDLSALGDIRALRFDPVEGTAVRCSLNSEYAKLVPMNAWANENGIDVFISEDPMYDVVLWNVAEDKQLHISGFIRAIDYKEKVELLTQQILRDKEYEIQVYKAQQQTAAQNYEALIGTQRQLQELLKQALKNNDNLREELRVSQECLAEKERMIAELNKTPWQKFGERLKKKNTPF